MKIKMLPVPDRPGICDTFSTVILLTSSCRKPKFSPSMRIACNSMSRLSIDCPHPNQNRDACPQTNAIGKGRAPFLDLPNPEKCAL